MIIVRYLIRETVKTQLAVLFVLFLVFFSQKFIRVLANATDGSIPGSEVLSLVALYMPSMAMLMLPLSLYIGILITFGKLYAESEITVMNATGMGNRPLLLAAFYLVLISGTFAACNALWLTPWANEKELEVIEKLEADAGLNLLSAGQIQTTPDGQAVIFINEIDDKNKTLNQIFIAQPLSNKKTPPNVVVAETGTISQMPDGLQVLDLGQGVRYEGFPARLDYRITHYDTYRVRIGQQKVMEKHRDWNAMTSFELFKHKDLRAQAELQWRISLILCMPLMTLIVIPLSAVNPRQGRFAKLFPAILIYLTYFLSISAAKSALEEGTLNPNIGLWGVNVVTLLIGIGLNAWDSLPMRKLKYQLRGAN